MLAVQATVPWLTIEGEEGIGKGQHIVFITGEEYYRSEEGISMDIKFTDTHRSLET